LLLIVKGSCRNFLFQRSCELGLFRLTADKIAQIFGVRKHQRMRGKLHAMLEKLDHGHHVLRIYCKSLLARMYESSPPSSAWRLV